MFVSINQRLDAEAITIIADEFGYDVEFTKSIEDEMEEEVADTDEELEERAPIVTIMGTLTMVRPPCLTTSVCQK